MSIKWTEYVLKLLLKLFNLGKREGKREGKRGKLRERERETKDEINVPIALSAFRDKGS